MKKFTKDEKMIAKNIDEKYKWIARDGNKRMYVFAGEPTKSVIANAWQTVDIASRFPYDGMFEAIKWEDDEPTRIRDIYQSHTIQKQRSRCAGIYQNRNQRIL